MAVNPLMVVVLPVAYLLIGTFSLLQFSAILQLVSQGAVKVRQMKQLAPIEPVVTTLVDYLTRIFGPLHKFTPQPTHVLLAAIVVALVVNGMRRK
ncbi:hypothetical protein HYH02_014546 [Chlamydomonas schloesseri]|uniref:Uncharacterized protein n=1 Tax=Chlamydomonas schloesseri TaxID=2026947 RepID=A0A835SWA7_9CHLO|nr:hypothetical protein HYH02_014546 [Chlamydomonas schloesseri]|eukprot:KAG2427715.1 hypothetical protein HYH02_014546 [Chlamydomonas schloesseri]